MRVAVQSKVAPPTAGMLLRGCYGIPSRDVPWGGTPHPSRQMPDWAPGAGKLSGHSGTVTIAMVRG